MMLTMPMDNETPFSAPSSTALATASTRPVKIAVMNPMRNKGQPDEVDHGGTSRVSRHPMDMPASPHN